MRRQERTCRGVNLGGWGSRPPDFRQGVVGVAMDRGRVVKYILLCTGSMVESGDFLSVKLP